jgi:hypothetical protein
LDYRQVIVALLYNYFIDQGYSIIIEEAKFMFNPILGKSLLVISLVLSILPSQSFGNTNPIPATGTTTNDSPGDAGWSGGFITNGTNRISYAVVIDSKQMYFGGEFTTAGNVLANHVAMWDGSTWQALGSGVNDPVFTLAVDGRGHLYAGGWFTQAGGKPANHIARWNGKDWEALGSGTNFSVATLVVDASGNVYAGGSFSIAGGVEVHSIAKWDGTSWSALGEGFSMNTSPQPALVVSLAIDRYGFLYAGGIFDHADGKPANNVARWDGSGWSALGEGVTLKSSSAFVQALAADGRGNIYAGGVFDTAGGIPAANLARWNGEAWSEVGGGIQVVAGALFGVNGIIADGGNIYVSGAFTTAGGNPAGGIALWNGQTWDNLNGGLWSEFTSPYVTSMGIDRDGRILVTGNFTLAGNQCADNIAAWNGTGWTGLGTETSVDGSIREMISDRKGGYYAAGDFVCAGGKVVNHIAHWDGLVWSALGKGLTGNSGASWGMPSALVLDQNDNLYVAGGFFYAGDVQVSGIAKWNGTDWEAFGDESIFNLFALAVDSQNRLYAGGYFVSQQPDPSRLYNVERWNGSHWEVIGTGFNSFVNAIVFDDQGSLIAGGYFNLAGEATANGLARWNGQSWEAVTDENVGAVNALWVDEETLYGGGSKIWKIQDGVLEVLGGEIGVGTGPMGSVQALGLDRAGRLVAGGSFEKIGVVNANNIARWDVSHWEVLGSGIGPNGIYSLLFDPAGRLLVAGDFSQAGNKASRNLAVWTEPNYLWFPLINR